MEPSTQLAVESALLVEKDEPGALLPVLHAIQDRIGHIPPAALPLIGKALNPTTCAPVDAGAVARPAVALDALSPGVNSLSRMHLGIA